MQTGINFPAGQTPAKTGTVNFGFRRPKFKVTRGRCYGGDIILDPLSRVDRGMQPATLEIRNHLVPCTVATVVALERGWVGVAQCGWVGGAHSFNCTSAFVRCVLLTQLLYNL